MYIKQVLNTCDTLYQNPYTESEKYAWCDELSELLALKYNSELLKTELILQNGKYILPENVSISLLEKIILGDEEVKKSEFARYGINSYDNFGRGEFNLPEGLSYSRVYAVYLKPHDKIRAFKLSGNISFGENCFFTDEGVFKQGDVLKITVGDEVFENVLVLETQKSEGRIKNVISNPLIAEGEREAEIEREITDKTVCPPPYDNMYVDFVLGKICYYQNDFSGCNNHMLLFNSKLSDYEKWLKSHPITGYSEVRLKNWW